MAAVAAALPAGWPGRSIAWLAIATMLLPEPPARPPVGCVDIDVLDVGQGLAVVLRTRRHAAVYDTGPAFRSGGDTGELVVVPFLRYVGSTRLDLAVISHADLDHAGGLASVAAAVPVSTILAGEPRETGAADQAIRCAAGQLWFWDAIRFRVLHPPGDTPSGGNNASCVLEVAAGNTRVLLTGDIESAVERRLLRDDLLEPAELVVIPHHGSKTSSHASFANALSAKVAVASAGHANRWGMPVAEVVERWRANGSVVLTTADDGALGYRVCGGAEPELLYRRRIDTRRFWNER
jgi:competence protein ComEC